MGLFRRRLTVREIKSATRLRLEPGDTLVLSCEDDLDPDELAAVKHHADLAIPGVKCLILTGGLALRAVLYERDKKAV